MRILITGSAGLIGSEAAEYYCMRDHEVHGIDNNMRASFFGPDGSTLHTRERLIATYKNYHHHDADIRDRVSLEPLFQNTPFDLLLHTAAQPSHDWAAREPLTDFGVNALATLLLLELTRQHCPQAVFIFTSTNKVYGDTPNRLPLVERETRFELPADHPFFEGIDETMSIDQSLHSVFGASKVAADVMVQEYGRYFGLRTGVFRGGCLTGPNHAGAQLHGFLNYLVRSIARGETYTVFGYKGKQVRDNIHARDVITAFDAFASDPRPGEVYNIGGSRFSNTSVLEAVSATERLLGKKATVKITPTPRMGDHQWYISDMGKFKSHYPDWHQEYGIERILGEILHSIDAS